MDVDLQLRIDPSPTTGATVAALRQGRRRIPCEGSVCAALGDDLGADVYAEAIAALDVAARVFGHEFAYTVGGHQIDAALLADVAIYHLTGAPGDVSPALTAFRRAAGPLLEPVSR